jgi:glycogen synthase
MHVLITSDTVGGVWTYTQELVSGLVNNGHRVTLVSFGRIPAPHQTKWMQTLPRFDYRPTEYRLEWMEVAERDIEDSRRYLQLLIDEVRPDVLHFSQYCYGDLETSIPKIVVAHSDIVSWWMAVHGREPDETPWMRNYRGLVTNGLRGADLVVAPSRWMLEQVSKCYLNPVAAQVIYNGRTPAMFDSQSAKDDVVLTVGRVWDPAKNAAIFLQKEQEFPVWVVGWEQEPGREHRSRSASVPANVKLLGAKSQDELLEIYAISAIYAGASRYEPFGLAPLEAALSGCALVLNDNPVFHELWGEAGVFFKRDDVQDAADAINRLRRDPALRDQYAARACDTAYSKFTAERMVAEYEHAYEQVASTTRAL